MSQFAKKLLWKLGPVALALLAVKCGATEPQGSESKRVAIDPDGDGLYAMITPSSDQLEARDCTAQPAVNANCPVVATASKATVLAFLTDQYQTQIAAAASKLEVEVKRLREIDAQTVQVKLDISAVESDILTKTPAITFARQTQATAKARLDLANAVLADLVSQLQTIFQKLAAQPTDATLLAMQIQVEDERNIAMIQRDDAAVTYSQKTTQLATLEAELAQLRSLLTVKTARLAELRLTLPVSSSITISLAQEASYVTTKKDVETAKVMAMAAESILIYKNSLVTPIQKDVASDVYLLIKRLFAPAIGIRLSPSSVLEVENGAVWRGVCDDGFNAMAAKVACRQLGKPFGAAAFSSIAGVDAFWLDDLNCTGSEANLFACLHSTVGVENCTTTDNIRLVCQ